MNLDCILVVEDDPNIRKILRIQLEGEGYRVLTAEDGAAGLEILDREFPDLVLLDVMMPNVDGLTVCRRIRADRRHSQTPIIFLTAKSGQAARIEGLVEGANDYIQKPYAQSELLLRVKNLISWSRAQRHANPLTGLPGNPAIDQEVERRLEKHEAFAFLYVDLDNFKVYNDRYSYRAGDNVIKLLAQILQDAVTARGTASDFVGHVGGDDFVIISEARSASDVAQEVVRRFDAAIPDYYSAEDRSRGYVELENRRGVVERFPLVSVTVALVQSERHHIEHLAMLNDIVAELKQHGKRMAGSVVVEERRHGHGDDLRTGSDG